MFWASAWQRPQKTKLETTKNKNEKTLAGLVLSACAPFCGQRQKEKRRTKVERKSGPKTEGKRDAEAMPKTKCKMTKI